MKILFTVASYYPVSGGVQMVTQYTAEGFVKMGHEVTVVTSCRDHKSIIDKHNGVRLLYTDVYKYFDIIRGNKRSYIEMVLKLAEEMDVLINVSLQTPTTDLLLPYLDRIKCKKILYLHDIHDFKWNKMDLSSPSRIISKLYYNFTRRVYYARLYKKLHSYDIITHLTPFDNSYKYMLKHHIDDNIIIGNAALDVMFEPSQKKLGKAYFLSVANYAEHKNQKFILKAFYNSGVDYEMIFIGREHNKYLDELIELKTQLDKKYGEKKVTFNVGISRTETEILIKNAKALILGSRVEKLPIVIIEAMASKIPFISTNVGSIKYLPGGYVIDSSEEMAYWMSFIAENEGCRKLMGLTGYEFALSKMKVQNKLDLLLSSIQKL